MVSSLLFISCTCNCAWTVVFYTYLLFSWVTSVTAFLHWKLVGLLLLLLLLQESRCYAIQLEKTGPVRITNA